MTAPHPEAPTRFEAPPTASTHFAWIRTRLSVERTLMAWVRTATALIGFGFTIVQFFERMGSMESVAPALRPGAPRYLGLALIAAGIAGLVISIHQYRKLVSYLLDAFGDVSGIPEVATQTPLQYIAFAVCGIGVFAFGAVLLRAV